MSLSVASAALRRPLRTTFSSPFIAQYARVVAACPSPVLPARWKSTESDSHASRTTGFSLKDKWNALVQEARQFKSGLVLLSADLKWANTFLVNSIIDGQISRRKLSYIIRTLVDMVKLFPFIVILAAPGGTLLLPIAVKYFPGLLPSAFERSKNGEHVVVDGDGTATPQAPPTVRSQLLQNLHDNIQSAQSKYTEKWKAEQDFQEEFSRLLSSSEEVGAVQLFLQQLARDDVDASDASSLRLAALLPRITNDMLLAEMPARQIRGVAQSMGIQLTNFPKPYVQHLLLRHWNALKVDDKLILTETVGNMTEEDLLHACASRGILKQSRGDSLPTGHISYVNDLRRRLDLWVTLSTKHQLSIGVLVMSKLFVHVPEAAHQHHQHQKPLPQHSQAIQHALGQSQQQQQHSSSQQS